MIRNMSLMRYLSWWRSALLMMTFLLPSISVGASSELKTSISENLFSATNWALEHNQKAGINALTIDLTPLIKRPVTIAVIDTGIQFNHPLLQGGVTNHNGLKVATAEDYGRDFSFGAVSTTQPSDQHGHGTHIAGILRSVFPSARIIPIKYYNAKAGEKENLNSTIKALEYAVSLKVDIINYSSGGAGASLDELRALKKAEEKGILVVAAAGNFASNIDEPRNYYYPASYGLQNIISVINHDFNLDINPSSNYGAESADISAPGSRIKSSLPHDRYGFLSGTSQSTAFVSGVAAQIKALHPEATPYQIKTILRQSARASTSLKGKCRSGGSLDAQMAIIVAEQIFRPKSSRFIASKLMR
ncbi:MAG: S8 family serine peptidase [Bdellovibrio sp.]|nr:S8 family serine peptidase [Bdellovibrio sp.]